MGESVSRRRFLFLGAGFFSVAALPFATGRPLRVVRRTLPVMGTIAEMAVVHPDPRRANAAIDGAFRALRRVEALMTRFRPDSDVGRANRLASRDAVPISAPTAEVLAEGLRWAEASEGAFDPCLGRAVELWDVAHRSEPPARSRVHRLAGRQLYRTLDLGFRAGSPVVRLGDDDTRIDLGGIAKGYGVDQAVDALRRSGIEHAIVNVGGDLYALGGSEDGDPWRIGVRRPDDPSRVDTTLRLADSAVATSGDYLQFFEHRGTRYHHLIDSQSGAPRRSELHSVTVIAETCMQADAAATTVFGMPASRAEKLLSSLAPGARRLV